MADQKIKIRIEADSSQVGRELAKTQSRTSRFLQQIRQSFVITFGDIQRAVQGAFNLIREAAELRGAEVALRRALNAQGQAFDEFIGKLKEVSDAQIATADLISSSGKALALGIPAEEIARLLEIARAASIRFGIDTTQAFDDIVKGIGRSSPLLLDNLGIVVNLTETYGKYAESIGESAENLTQQQKAAALLNRVLEEGEENVKTYTSAQDELSATINKSTAAFKNLTNTAGGVLSGTLLALSSVVATSILGFTLLASAVVETARAFTTLLASLPIVGSALDGINKRLNSVSEILTTGRASLLEFAENNSKAADALTALALGLTKVEDKLRSNTPATRDNAKAREDAAAAAEEEEEAIEDTTEALDADTRARERSIAVMRIQQEQIRLTAAQYDVLARSAGEAAAVQAALAGGGELVQGGTRIRFERGGSRLVRARPNTQGGAFRVSLGPRTITLPNGTLLN